MAPHGCKLTAMKGTYLVPRWVLFCESSDETISPQYACYIVIPAVALIFRLFGAKTS